MAHWLGLGLLNACALVIGPRQTNKLRCDALCECTLNSSLRDSLLACTELTVMMDVGPLNDICRRNLDFRAADIVLGSPCLGRYAHRCDVPADLWQFEATWTWCLASSRSSCLSSSLGVYQHALGSSLYGHGPQQYIYYAAERGLVATFSGQPSWHGTAAVYMLMFSIPFN